MLISSPRQVRSTRTRDRQSILAATGGKGEMERQNAVHVRDSAGVRRGAGQRVERRLLRGGRRQGVRRRRARRQRRRKNGLSRIRLVSWVQEHFPHYSDGTTISLSGCPRQVQRRI